MTTITIEQVEKHDGQEVTLKGWLYNLRESGKLLFPIFRDGTGIIQGVCALKENPEAFEALKGLTQEGQLYIEATAMALGKVYTFGPTFRAEKSKTRRHLTEFWMLEPEAAYVEMDEAMGLGEGLVSAIVGSVLKNKSRELEILKRDTTKLQNVKP